MKILLLTIVASLCALILYPVVLSVGQRLAKKLKKVQDDDDDTSGPDGVPV